MILAFLFNLMTNNEFEKLVAAAVDDLPQSIKNVLDNVAIVVEPAGDRNLLGLYEGIPENEWGKSQAIRLPDKITIFKDSIEKEASSLPEIQELVRLVVWHEIAHHFGFKESQMAELEKKWRTKGLTLDKK